MKLLVNYLTMGHFFCGSFFRPGIDWGSVPDTLEET